eukprot:jgi/Ulvmu1/7013/UM033_0072.1
MESTMLCSFRRSACDSMQWLHSVTVQEQGAEPNDEYISRILAQLVPRQLDACVSSEQAIIQEAIAAMELDVPLGASAGMSQRHSETGLLGIMPDACTASQRNEDIIMVSHAEDACLQDQDSAAHCADRQDVLVMPDHPVGGRARSPGGAEPLTRPMLLLQLVSKEAAAGPPLAHALKPSEACAAAQAPCTPAIAPSVAQSMLHNPMCSIDVSADGVACAANPEPVSDAELPGCPLSPPTLGYSLPDCSLPKPCKKPRDAPHDDQRVGGASAGAAENPCSHHSRIGVELGSPDLHVHEEGFARSPDLFIPDMQFACLSLGRNGQEGPEHAGAQLCHGGDGELMQAVQARRNIQDVAKKPADCGDHHILRSMDEQFCDLGDPSDVGDDNQGGHSNVRAASPDTAAAETDPAACSTKHNGQPQLRRPVLSFKPTSKRPRHTAAPHEPLSSVAHAPGSQDVHAEHGCDSCKRISAEHDVEVAAQTAPVLVNPDVADDVEDFVDALMRMCHPSSQQQTQKQARKPVSKRSKQDAPRLVGPKLQFMNTTGNGMVGGGNINGDGSDAADPISEKVDAHMTCAQDASNAIDHVCILLPYASGIPRIWRHYGSAK